MKNLCIKAISILCCIALLFALPLSATADGIMEPEQEKLPGSYTQGADPQTPVAQDSGTDPVTDSEGEVTPGTDEEDVQPGNPSKGSGTDELQPAMNPPADPGTDGKQNQGQGQEEVISDPTDEQQMDLDDTTDPSDPPAQTGNDPEEEPDQGDKDDDKTPPVNPDNENPEEPGKTDKQETEQKTEDTDPGKATDPDKKTDTETSDANKTEAPSETEKPEDDDKTDVTEETEKADTDSEEETGETDEDKDKEEDEDKEEEKDEEESGALPEDRWSEFEILWDVENPGIGDVAHFVATLHGYDELEYSLQWQFSRDGETWEDVPDETEPTMDVVVTEEKATFRWRLMVYVYITVNTEE